jgi:ATP-dependent Clp protease ATP-binding subunit ClpC
MKSQVTSELKEQFRPEFLNRLDDIIVFQQLTQDQVRQIVDLQITDLNHRLFERHMSIDLTDQAKNLLTEKGFDPLLGARPLRRVIQRDIEDAISEKILMGELHDNEAIKVDAEGEGLLGDFTFTGTPFIEGETTDSGSKGDGTSGSSGTDGADGTDGPAGGSGSGPDLPVTPVTPNNSGAAAQPEEAVAAQE